MSALPQHDQRVTCVSCRFSYPEVRGFCPMCGTAAPAPGEAVLGPRPVEGKSRTARQLALSASLKRGMRRPLFVAVFLLIAGGTLLYLRSRNARDVIAPAPAIAATTPLAAAQPAVVAPEESAAPPPAAVEKPVMLAAPTATRAAATNDPAELWNRVRKGNSDAEVALAELYLNGKGVAQNCEQAHLLLLAAVKKRNRAADQVLTNLYPQRCP